MGIFSKLAGSFVKDRVSNTKTAIQLIIEDFKRYALILKWIFLSFSAFTLIYSIVTKTGNLIINSCLLGLLVVYAILDTILRRREDPNPTRHLRRIYVWSKIALNAIALASSLYALYTATADIKPLQIVLATLSMIMFVLKVFIEICLEVFSSKWIILKNAMIMDAKEHPKTSAKIFSPFIGDIEEVDVKESIAEKIRRRQNDE